MMFATRDEAGCLLGGSLKDHHALADLVLGLPRGGVLVAAEVANTLDLPLDVLVVRKIGHPAQREFAVGALAEPDVVVLDPAIVGVDPAIHRSLMHIVREEKERLRHCRAIFHLGPPAELRDKSVILVDDGLATGATTEAAIVSARKQGAGRVIAATPVASGDAVRRLSKVADEVVALHVDEDFDAVGRYYRVFHQASDEEVLAALRAARRRGD